MINPQTQIVRLPDKPVFSEAARKALSFYNSGTTGGMASDGPHDVILGVDGFCCKFLAHPQFLTFVRVGPVHEVRSSLSPRLHEAALY